MAFVMQCVRAAVFDKAEAIADIVTGRAEYVYLREFDAEAHGGRGHVLFTDDITKAMRFETERDVLMCWRTQSWTVPLRDDGRPNRPLTAYSVSPLEVPPQCRKLYKSR